jgi:hypothetical protein
LIILIMFGEEHLLLYPRETAPCTYCIGVWVRHIAGYDIMEKRKILPLPEIEPRPSSL